MRILIVDDDPAICAGTVFRVKRMNRPEIRGIEVAYSGEAALEIICGRHVDILITDIRMNDMDGLELIRRALRHSPDLVCTIITAYDDFNYAKRAISLGVTDFLVKPCSEGEMRGCVLKAIERRLAHRSIKQGLLDRDLMEACGGQGSCVSIAALFARHGVEAPDGAAYLLVCERDDFSLPPTADIWCYRPHRRGLALCVAPRGGEAAIERFAETVQRSGDQSVGVAAIEGTLAEAYLRASQALNCRWYSERGAVYRWSESPKGYDEATMGALSGAIDALDAAALSPLLERLADPAAVDAMAASRYLTHCVDRINEAVRCQSGPRLFRSPLQPYVGVRFAIDQIVREVARLGSDVTIDSARVATAKRYVAEHLGEPIDMAAVANHLNLSYAYFSRIFSNETGKSFSRYVVERRLEETCQRMLRGERLVDIAVRVGYHNANNLTRSFTREYGVSPSAWLKAHSNSEEKGRPER